MKYLFLSILFFVSQKAVCGSNTKNSFQSSQTIRAVPGEFLVELRSDLSQSFMQNTFNELESQFGLSMVHQLPNTNIFLFRQKNSQMALTAEEITQAPLFLSEVLEVEPNLIFSASKVPNDPLYSHQWGLKNSGQPILSRKKALKGIDINIEPVWDTFTGSHQVIVAVVDSGINYLHPDLKQNIWVNVAEQNGKQGVDDDNNGFVDDVYGYDFVNHRPNAMDDFGHGSHCAGIIGASGNNSAGVAGINWTIRLMPVKFLNNQGNGTLENAVNAMNYAFRNGAQIINASWGAKGTSRLIEKAIFALNKKNILIVAAAGNEMSDNDIKPMVPGSIIAPNLITVAALDNNGQLARFSNYGVKSVQIAAPGVDILSTVLGNNYEYMSGTSMAAPFVAGVSAILLAHDPSLKTKDIKNKLMRKATPLTDLLHKVTSHGMVNAYDSFSGR
ncbi:MAG: S8 family peptidase [Pseudobdellovibrionaceae bacterium]